MTAVVGALTGELGWPVAVLLCAVSFAASLLTAAFGIGGGTVMLAVLASLLPVPAVIPVHGLVQLGSNAGRTAVFRRHVWVPVLLPFTLGALAGVALGGSVVVALPPEVLKLALGLFILWTVWLPPPGVFGRSAAAVGVVSSVLTMFFGGTGPFVAAYVRTLDLPRMRFVGTHAALMTVQHLLKSVVFGLLGFGFAGWLPLVALMIGAGLLGTLVGRHLLMRIDEAMFRRVLAAILTLLALRLIWGGMTGLLA